MIVTIVIMRISVMMVMMTNNSDDNGDNNSSDYLPVWTIFDDKEMITTGNN